MKMKKKLIRKKEKDLIGKGLINESSQRKKDFWITGGIIGILFSFFYFFIVNYLPSFNRFICVEGKESFFNCIGIKYLQSLGFPSLIVKIDLFKNFGTSAKGIFAIIFILLFYMLLGGLIGYVYGKFNGGRK